MANFKMELQYQIRVMTDGTDVEAVYQNVTQLVIRRRFREIGMATILVHESHDIIQYLVRDRRFMIMFLEPDYTPTSGTMGQQWALVFQGLLRDWILTTDENGNLYYMLYVMGLPEIVDRYICAYPTGVNDRSSWVGQECGLIARDLLLYNATSLGTAVDGRVRDVTVVRGFHMQYVLGTQVIDFMAEPGTPLLDVVKDLAKLGPFDWYVTTTDFYVPGGCIFIEAIPFDGTISSDRSTTMHFHTSLDNLNRISFSRDSLAERTVAIVGGAGDGTGRVFHTRTGANYATPTHDREMWVNGRTNTNDELDAVGDKALVKVQARSQINASIASSIAYSFVESFDDGDLISFHIGGQNVVKQVATIEIVFDQTQRPSINVELMEPPN